MSDISDEKREIHKVICDCNVSITFKGFNPNIKETIMNLLCDSFEERVMREVGENTEKKSS